MPYMNLMGLGYTIPIYTAILSVVIMKSPQKSESINTTMLFMGLDLFLLVILYGFYHRKSL